MKTDKEIKNMPLVEQLYNYTREQGFKITRQKAYKTAVESNLVDKNGNPTQWAMDNGMVDEVKPHDFLHLDYPSLLNQSYDEYSNEQIMNDEQMITKKQMYRMLLEDGIIFPNGKPTPKAVKEQMVSWGDFLPSLALQSKMTIKQFIQVVPALHKYKPERFHFVDGKGYAFDISVTYDLAKRAFEGEIAGDKNSAYSFMNHLKAEYGDDIEPL